MADLGINFNQLRTAVEWSNKQFERPRENRIKAIREFVGFHYADEGSDRRVPTNMIELAVTIYSRQLMAQTPRAMISTPITSLKPFARNMEINLNKVPIEIGLEKTMQNAVIEALFGIGCVKVGIASTGKFHMGHDIGESFVDLVTLDDYFCDMSAKSRQTMQFEGNDYWLPVESARALFNKNMDPDDHTVQGAEGEDRAEGVSSEEGADLYKEKVWLRDVWLQDSNKLVTYGVKSNEIFSIVDWDGPEGSPYHILSFSDVPGNIMPLAPVALWTDLHDLGNNLFRKLANQAEAKKKVAAFAGGNDDDVDRLKAAKDGEGITYAGQKPEEISVGGIDSPTLAFYLQTKDLFSYFAGNLDALGGLSPMSDTVGQDKLMTDAAGARIAHMQSETVGFAKRIFNALAWYEWTDPVRKRTLDKPVEGTEVVLRVNWTPETREGDFLDYNIDIDVYSMQDNSPAVKLQKLGSIMQQYVLPLMPILEAQGAQIDAQRLIDMVSEYSNMPELNEIIRFADGPMPEQAPRGNPQPATMPSNTTRTYDRVVRPGATRSGKDDVMSRILMGSGVQSAEAGNLTQGVG